VRRSSSGTQAATETIMTNLPAKTMPAPVDETSLFAKLRRHGLAAGREVVEKVLWLWFASRRPDLPVWARTAVYGALAYFVLPTDAIPDLLPGLGYTDDIGVLSYALVTIASYVDADVRRRTAGVLARLFAGPATPST
jgi:uncharacterized membrane protein YkvA (DUF1232 family)